MAAAAASQVRGGGRFGGGAGLSSYRPPASALAIALRRRAVASFSFAEAAAASAMPKNCEGAGAAQRGHEGDVGGLAAEHARETK